MRLARLLPALLLLLGVALGCESSPATGSDSGVSDAALSDGGASDAGAAPDAGPHIPISPVLPTSTGTCPDLTGTGTVTVQPEGMAARDLLIWSSDAATAMEGPVVFFWHGAGGQPSDIEYGLGQDTIDAIVALGGIVVSPFQDPGNGDVPWFLTAGAREDDLLIADELVACAEETLDIDETHIHSTGFSAGALHTTQMSFRRSSYLASVVTYSGGLIVGNPMIEEPRNEFAAMILHGGPNDIVFFNFRDTSERYWNELDRRGHFAVICDHGLRHTVPPSSRPSALAFLLAHPFDTESPYADGLPEDFYAACQRMP